MVSDKYKKFLSLIILTVFSVLELNAFAYTQRLKAMADIGTAVSSDETDFFYNPAMQGYVDSTFGMLISAGMGDTFSFNKKNLILSDPSGFINIIFTGKRISAFITDDLSLKKETVTDDIKYYDAIQNISLGINYAVKLGSFSLGAGITGNMNLIRPNIRISDNNRFTDIIINCLFESYQFSEDSEKLNIRLGGGYTVNNFTIGLLIPDFYNYRADDAAFKPMELLNSLTFGFYYEVPDFTVRGRLRALAGSVGIDIHNISNLDEIGIKIGGEIKLQITSDYKISLLAGYKTVFSKIKKGTISTGLCAKLREFNIYLNFYLIEFSKLKSELSLSYSM